MATFFSGVLIAFICCWEVSMLTFLVVPAIIMIGGTYTKKMNAISATKMLHLSAATSMVEQVKKMHNLIYDDATFFFCLVVCVRQGKRVTSCLITNFLISQQTLPTPTPPPFSPPPPPFFFSAYNYHVLFTVH